MKPGAFHLADVSKDACTDIASAGCLAGSFAAGETPRLAQTRRRAQKICHALFEKTSNCNL